MHYTILYLLKISTCGGSSSAIVPIRVMNTRGYRLPKTGDAGTTLLAVGGMTLAVLSAAAVALLLVFKKKDKFDD